jgi:hypothetical protein
MQPNNAAADLKPKGEAAAKVKVNAIHQHEHFWSIR